MALLGPPLMSPPKVRLSRLRDISWSVWDPIGLMGVGQNWQDKDCRPFANEYDGYLLQAAGRLRGGKPHLILRLISRISRWSTWGLEAHFKLR